MIDRLLKNGGYNLGLERLGVWVLLWEEHILSLLEDIDATELDK